MVLISFLFWLIVVFVGLPLAFIFLLSYEAPSHSNLIQSPQYDENDVWYDEYGNRRPCSNIWKKKSDPYYSPVYDLDMYFDEKISDEERYFYLARLREENPQLYRDCGFDKWM